VLNVNDLFLIASITSILSLMLHLAIWRFWTYTILGTSLIVILLSMALILEQSNQDLEISAFVAFMTLIIVILFTAVRYKRS
jgi:hypothetical protein